MDPPLSSSAICSMLSNIQEMMTKGQRPCYIDNKTGWTTQFSLSRAENPVWEGQPRTHKRDRTLGQCVERGGE